MKREESKTRKIELFKYMLQLKPDLVSSSTPIRLAAWEEVFSKGKELGLAGRSSTARQFKTNCVVNAIRSTADKVRRQKEVVRLGGVPPELVLNTLDQLVIDFIGPNANRLAVNEGRLDDILDKNKPEDKAAVHDQLKQMGFTVALDAQEVPANEAAAANASALADQLFFVQEKMLVEDAVSKAVPEDGAGPVLPSEGNSQAPAAKPPPLPTSLIGGQRTSSAASGPRPYPSAVGDTQRASSTATRPSGSGLGSGASQSGTGLGPIAAPAGTGLGPSAAPAGGGFHSGAAPSGTGLGPGTAPAGAGLGSGTAPADTGLGPSAAVGKPCGADSSTARQSLRHHPYSRPPLGGSSVSSSTAAAQKVVQVPAAQKVMQVPAADEPDRVALGIKNRRLLALPAEQLTSEERTTVNQILQIRMLKRILAEAEAKTAEIRHLASLVLASTD